MRPVPPRLTMAKSFATIVIAAALIAQNGPLTAQQASSTPAGAPTPSSPPASAAALTIASAVRAVRAPAIDGRDDDGIWANAPRYSSFRQFQPKADADASFRTEFRTAFDEHNLYVFVRMYDPHPDSIMHALSRRDVRESTPRCRVQGAHRCGRSWRRTCPSAERAGRSRCRRRAPRSLRIDPRR